MAPHHEIGQLVLCSLSSFAARLSPIPCAAGEIVYEPGVLISPSRYFLIQALDVKPAQRHVTSGTMHLKKLTQIRFSGCPIERCELGDTITNGSSRNVVIQEPKSYRFGFAVNLDEDAETKEWTQTPTLNRLDGLRCITPAGLAGWRTGPGGDPEEEFRKLQQTETK